MSDAPGRCIPDQHHEPEPVQLLDGTTIGHVCRHCLVQLRHHRGLDTWQPYDDDGRPLPTLPDPTYRAAPPDLIGVLGYLAGLIAFIAAVALVVWSALR